MFSTRMKLPVTTAVGVSLLLAAATAFGQEQVLAEVGAAGSTENGDQGIVIPDFTDDDPVNDYADWVVAASDRDFRGFAISATGTALVLDGTVIREFAASGAEKTNAGFPVDCTALEFDVPKGNGTQKTSLSDCGAFTPLNDGTIRIAGQIKRAGFVMIGYTPDTGDVTLKASGTPPSITDMDGDESDEAGSRKGSGYWAVGERKKVVFFPLADEQAFEVVATLNGTQLDGITPFGVGRVIVALTTGELRAVDSGTGASVHLAPLPVCGGKKDPQKFSVRGDPSGTLFVGNLGCREIRLLDGNGQLIQDAELSNPLVLDNPQDFLVQSLDWQSGQGGDFVDCQGANIQLGCEFGAQEDQAVMWSVENITGTDTTFRMFQFVDLVDCRWSSEGISADAACPVINCNTLSDGMCVDPAKELQVLDLAPLLIRADKTGAFEQQAFGDETPPVMAIPAYMRGEECFPSSSDPTDCLDNGYRFHSFFAITDAVFTGNFSADYQIDEFRAAGVSEDPCVIPDPETSVQDINETANLIVYSSDTFDTVSSAEAGRGAVVINDACNGQAAGIRWSAQTVGLELHDEGADAYVHHASRMMQELKQAGDELLCSPFADPDGGPDLGPLLEPSGPDCSAIAKELQQMEDKLATCFGTLYFPQDGSSAENCNAFFTKVQNLQNALDATAWPDPNDPSNLDVLRPNYEGEFRARLASLLFFINSYVFNSVPDGGFLVE